MSNLKTLVTAFLDDLDDLDDQDYLKQGAFFHSDFSIGNDDNADQYLLDNNITVEYVDNYGGEEMGRDYWSVYSFAKDGETVYVQFDGWYESYNGSEYEEWFFVEPKPVQKIEFVKVK